MKEFEKVIGYESVKQELMQICDALKNTDKYKHLGASAPKGLMLYGAPGTGKTLMANTLIEAIGYKHYVCRKDKPNGEFVNHIREMFEKAEKNAPSILLLDDMDKFANEDEKHRNAEEYVTVQSCIDAVRDKDVFVIATVNDIHNLPYSLRRAGRFDRIIRITMPKGNDAKLITNHYLSKLDYKMDLDFNTVGRIMKGKTCAELECIVNRAGLLACYENSEEITIRHFMRAYLKQKENIDICSIETLCNNRCINLRDGANRMAQTIYHEAGHLVAAEVLHDNSVTYACIYGETGRISGITSVDIDDDDVLEKWLSRVVIGLAGKATVEQKFGVHDIGGELDMEKAVNIIGDLIKNKAIYGASLFDKFDHGISEHQREKQEMTIIAEVERLYFKAKEVIAKNWEFVERIAKAMSEEVLLVAEDVQKIKAECNIVRVCVG